MTDGKLKPNVKYKTGEYNYIYSTDEARRITKFEAQDLKLTQRGSRLKHNSNTLGKQANDHAGHLAGDRFGGSKDLDNLVSQSKDVNLSQYKKIENQWAKALKEGKKVSVETNVKYDRNSLRPSKFEVKYTIDGKSYRKNILNN